MQGETLHNILLTIHIIGAFVMLMGIGLLMVTMVGLRRARTYESLRQVLYGGRYVERIMPIGTLIVMIAGIWLAFLKDPDYNWHSAWIITAVVLVIIFSINGGANIGKKMERLGRSTAGKDGNLPARISKLANSPSLHYSSWMGIGVIFAFVVLMVDKPNWIGSVFTVVVGLFAGLVANFLIDRLSASPTSFEQITKTRTGNP